VSIPLRHARLRRYGAAVVCLLLTVGCKSGETIGSGISPATPAFEADAVPAGLTDHYVRLRVNSTSGGRIVLDVVVHEVVEPVTGIALKLTYPSAFSRFTRCSDGDLFPAGQCYFAEPAAGSGEVFIGRSVTGAGQATPVSGDRVIVRVEFLVFGIDSGPIVIEGQNLGGSDASALLDGNGDPIFVQWLSGTLRGLTP